MKLGLSISCVAGTPTQDVAVTPPPVFSTQPTISGIFEVGQTLTLSAGTVAPAATLTITKFTLDGIDKSAEISGLEWDTTGEDVSGGGVIEYQVTATDGDGSTLSDMITATLNQPAVTPPPVFSAQPAISGIFEVGQILALSLGTAAPAATLTITKFTLDGIDKSAEISGLEWDTTGADIAGGGVIEYQVTATNGDGSTLSDMITATLDQPAGDTTAPVFSGVSTSASVTSATLDWATSEGNGTAFWICSTSPTAPSEVQISAGQDHSDAVAIAGGSYSVSAAGPQTAFTATGLTTGTTYFFHLLHKDAAGNSSAVYTTSGVTVSNVSATIDVIRRSRLGVAPEAFYFEATVSGFDTGTSGAGVYNPQFHELHYAWDFDDSYTFTAPVNLPDAKKSSGTSYGPMVSHTYRSAGTYRVTCVVTEPSSGKTATTTRDVTIGDANTLFSAGNTIFMSPSGDFTDAPSGAARITSANVSSVLSSNILGTDTTPKRLMLNRGESYALSGTGLGNNSGSKVPSLHIVAGPGAGANPAVTCTGGFLWADNNSTGLGNDKDIVFQNIDWTGPWDSVNESGSSVTFFACFANAPNQIVSDGCLFDGFSISFYITNAPNSDHRGIVLNDTTITNWRDYGISCGQSDGGMIMTGSSIRCHVDANAGGPKDGNHNEHGPIRHNSGKNLIVTNTEFYSRTGWSQVASYQAPQPCMRINAGGFTGMRINAQHCLFEGGYGVLSFTVQGGSSPQPVNAVVDKCYFLGHHQTTAFVVSQMGGITVRNCVAVQPNVPRLAGSQRLFSFVSLDGNAGGDATNKDTPISVYGNTLVNLMEDANFAGTVAPSTLFTGETTFTTVNEGNNLMHQPNVTGGSTTYAPLVTSPALWVPREKGYKDENTARITSTATPANTVALYAPDIGSAALGDALNGLVAYDDFFGNQRPQYPSRGALEMQ